jgi:hypothetical protein
MKPWKRTLATIIIMPTFVWIFGSIIWALYVQ